VRAHGFTTYIFQYLHETKTRFIKINYTDMNIGDSPSMSAIWGRMFSYGAKQVHKTMTQLMHKMDAGMLQNDSVIASHSAGLYFTLQENNSKKNLKATNSYGNLKEAAVNSKKLAASKGSVLKRLVYLSRATDVNISNEELTRISNTANAFNSTVNVTGLLLYANGIFYQELEGETQTVDSLYEKISKDKRHDRVCKVKEEYEIDRQYEKWSMRTVNLQHMEGYHAELMKQFIQVVMNTTTLNGEDKKGEEEFMAEVNNALAQVK